MLELFKVGVMEQRLFPRTLVSRCFTNILLKKKRDAFTIGLTSNMLFYSVHL